MYRAVRPLLFQLHCEWAHNLGILGLKIFGRSFSYRPPPRLSCRVFGLDFPSPIGIAAGFDKNAEVPDALLGLGFGFAEVGTLTPRPQSGNPRPRMFRLVEDLALVNRLGFNNAGLKPARARLHKRLGRGGIVGVNLGPNKDSADRYADYEHSIAQVVGLCAYITINISSPNTAGLRELQSRDALDELLSRCLAARGAHPTPLLVKIAPDLTDQQARDLADTALARGVDGLIISNTTTARVPGLQSPYVHEIGGLSGRPLMRPATELLRQLAHHTKRKLPLVGVGGIASGADAYEKIRKGACLVQLYTGLIYEGPQLPRRIAQELDALLARDGFAHVSDAIGADVHV